VIVTKFFVHVACGHGLVFWRGDEIPRGKGNFGGFLPLDNALQYNTMNSIAFGTHTKTAEPIKMPFGMMSGLGPRNSVLRRGDDPQRQRGMGNLGGKRTQQA